MATFCHFWTWQTLPIGWEEDTVLQQSIYMLSQFAFEEYMALYMALPSSFGPYNSPENSLD